MDAVVSNLKFMTNGRTTMDFLDIVVVGHASLLSRTDKRMRKFCWVVEIRHTLSKYDIAAWPFRGRSPIVWFLSLFPHYPKTSHWLSRFDFQTNKKIPHEVLDIIDRGTRPKTRHKSFLVGQKAKTLRTDQPMDGRTDERTDGHTLI